MLAALAVIVAASSVFSQSVEPVRNQQGRPLNMLVLGDSILWGEGLRGQHKSWYQVKVWLETNTGRPVIEKIEAHAGAVIERGSTTERLTATNPEVNVALPSVNDQLDDALRICGLSEWLRQRRRLAKSSERLSQRGNRSLDNGQVRASDGETGSANHHLVSGGPGNCGWILSILFLPNSKRLRHEGSGAKVFQSQTGRS